MAEHHKKLGVGALTGLVIGAMVGGGIFSLPQNMAQQAGAGAVLSAWLITGGGMLFLVLSFSYLGRLCPEATTGIYAYTRRGFGRFGGFEMAWFYWISNIFGNVGFAILLMDALNYFFPGVFQGGNNLWSIVGGSVLLWLINALVARGVHLAAVLNTAGTVVKLLVLALFIIVLARTFNWNLFQTDFWGQGNPAVNVPSLGSWSAQVKSTMLVTLWAFIGIEGAVVVSNRAKSQQAVNQATIGGFFGCLLIYALLSLLPFGVMPQAQLAVLAPPSTAGLLEFALHHHWGGVIMNLGVIIALLTSWLSFSIMIAQIPLAAAQDGTFPRFFTRLNRYGEPGTALGISTALMQLTLLAAAGLGDAWHTMLSITSVMILPPYLGCTWFLCRLARAPEFPERCGISRRRAWCCGLAGSLYAIWMIYAGGVHYLGWAVGIGVMGIPIYYWARRQNGHRLP